MNDARTMRYHPPWQALAFGKLKIGKRGPLLLPLELPLDFGLSVRLLGYRTIKFAGRSGIEYSSSRGLLFTARAELNAVASTKPNKIAVSQLWCAATRGQKEHNQVFLLI